MKQKKSIQTLFTFYDDIPFIGVSLAPCAVGRESFTTDIQQQLASRAQKRSIVSVNGATVLKEPEIPYSTVFSGKKGVLSPGNAYLWR